MATNALQPKTSPRDPARRNVCSYLAFAVLVSLIAAVAILYSINIYRWGEYPDYGYSFRAAAVIGTVANVTENGRKAGILPGDRILKANGGAFTSFEELRALLHKGLGEENAYLVSRAGTSFTVRIANVPVGFGAAFLKSGLPFLLGLSYGAIGVVVFLMKPHVLTSWVFLLAMGTFGCWMFSLNRIGVVTPAWLEGIELLAYCVTPAAFLHLAACFPEKRVFIMRHPGLQAVPYVLAAILFSLMWSQSAAIIGAPQFLLNVLSAFMACSILYYLGSTVQVRIASASELAKSRSKVILLGSAISAVLPLIDFVSGTCFDAYIFPNPNFQLPFLVLFPLTVAYAMVKHDLFDIDAIVKRTYGYLIITGAVAGLYGLFVLGSNAAFGGYEISRSAVFPLVFITVVLLIFNPLRDRVQRFVDRVFYRLEFDYQATVQQISETMRSLLSLDQVGQSIMDTALKTLFIDHGYILLIDRERTTYDCLIEAGRAETSPGASGLPQPVSEDACAPLLAELKIPAREPLIGKLSEHPTAVTVYDIEEAPEFEGIRQECRSTFERMQAQLLVPLVYEKRLTGLIALGRKKSGKFYRREEINLLNVLANQGAVALENAKMVRDVIEKERMEEELSIARDLQVSMLPADCPQVRGFEIAACSMPAREVGGDFYDFIRMESDRLGVVVGDVTGKSVSGALVMSAARSVFRMLSEEPRTAAENMMRANRRLKQDVKSGMFVALLYVILDGRHHTLTLCSAGQTQPVLSKGGGAVLVETRGDTFPLGILEDPEYEDTVLSLSEGDVVVLYTDGIVEAMNAKGEIFGFERLIDTVNSDAGGSPDALLREILDRVQAFCGDSPQHDDVTLIVVRASRQD